MNGRRYILLSLFFVFWCRMAASTETERPILVIGFTEARLISGTQLTASVVDTAPADWPGMGLKVDFAAAVRPELRIPISEGTADWSSVQQLAIPVRNLDASPVSLAVRVDGVGSDGAPPSRSGIARLEPQETVVLVLPLKDNGAVAMGMREGPPPPAPQLDRPVRVIGGAHGKIDLHRVSTIHLALPYLDSNHRLLLGAPAIIRGRDPGRSAYREIVDRFGQYTRATWPEKISSTTDLQERGRREDRLRRKWLATLPPRDRFGGILQGPAFKATGFFRTERANSRWRLVTPEGHAFFSLAVDVVSPDIGATVITGREFMFTGLPGKDEPLARHFGTRHGAATFNFYAANLQRKLGPDYLAAWRRAAIARLRAWGFNTIGNWSEPQLIASAGMPYVLPIDIWGDFAQIGDGANPRNNMPDVFDPKFAAAVDRIIGNATSAHKADPYLIGYFVDNELPWRIGRNDDPRLRYALAINTLRLGADSPAKRAFVQLVAEKYRRADALARSWGVAIPSWEALTALRLTLPAAALTRPTVESDLSAFTADYAEVYFRLVATALHHGDPNHLYLGSRFQTSTPEAVEVCARYCDIVSFNIYKREVSDEARAPFRGLAKPVIIGEFQFGTADRGLFWPGLYNVAAEEERGPAYARYLRSALANPDIVGCHWFQYVDEPLTGRALDGENGHVGFVSVADAPYAGFVAAARAANLALLHAFH
jgi:hypothetical protein